MKQDSSNHPHSGQPVLNRGGALSESKAAVILMHGRGASAQSILSLQEAVSVDGVAWLAPQANTHAWYPNTFLSPIEKNQPGYSSSLMIISELIDHIKKAGIAQNKIILAGFSQGACLASEYAARFPEKFGGIVVFSGGLIGETINKSSYKGELKNTPVFIGCSDIDTHIPVERVHETADVLSQLGGEVTKKIYPGMGHSVNDEELGYFRNMLMDLI